MFLGEYDGNRLRQGHSRTFATDTANLVSDPDGNLSITISQKSEYAFGGENWFQTITANNTFYLEAAGAALEAFVKGQSPSHFCQRFLDA